MEMLRQQSPGGFGRARQTLCATRQSGRLRLDSSAMWPQSGTVLSVSSRAMIGACDRLGIDTGELLRSVGIARATLDDPDARLEASKVGALWARAYELSRDPVLSLHAAEACPIGAYKVIDFKAANAATVGAAFRYASRYFPLIN